MTRRPGRNVHEIVNDTASMLKTVIAIAAAATALMLAGCGDSEPAAEAPPTSTSSTPPRDFGMEIAERSDTIAAIINVGCGALPKPTCEASGEQLASHARLLRELIVESGRNEFYSPALKMIDDIASATSSPARRSAALDLVAWLEENPT